ncbi:MULTISPECIES: hypothetical protein [Vibrio]|uniref:hypothetical protein n=1 Tax=Vibrio TaxID=662 RepID=UPI0006A598E5|nr:MULTISPECIES: hypothetical protein [Vibrio]ELA6650037.1 hypothetical protein [Vibrio alginolyticus]KOF27159.1 hypothetical protein ACX09_21015 [Vibrio alginolyticus]KOF27170.1 hypothetical protein ACX09_21080 [Vibrio alginolyticus]MCA2453046.1 hypothetical protein [Vibrio alginolyticus]MCA2476948.1 hypothetical protein [Vibrio alginolyticus]
MVQRKPEQDLIDGFVCCLKRAKDPSFRAATIINFSCKAKKYADVEYISEDGTRWVIEAKSHDSSDRHNTVHKLFGELLKETGRPDRGGCLYGLLIPAKSLSFYSRLLQSINRDIFIGFGKLIPISAVFLYGDSRIRILTWESLYDAYKP